MPSRGGSRIDVIGHVQDLIGRKCGPAGRL